MHALILVFLMTESLLCRWTATTVIGTWTAAAENPSRAALAHPQVGAILLPRALSRGARAPMVVTGYAG